VADGVGMVGAPGAGALLAAVVGWAAGTCVSGPAVSAARGVTVGLGRGAGVVAEGRGAGVVAAGVGLGVAAGDGARVGVLTARGRISTPL